MINGVEYKGIDDDGLHYIMNNEPHTLNVDNIIICAGQDPQRELLSALESGDVTTHLIGGADKAVELDAKRAIDQGARLAAQI